MTIEAIVGAKTHTKPKLSFDGKSLFFLKEAESDTKQVFHMDLATRNRTKVSDETKDISEFFVSPYANHLCIMVSGGAEKHKVRYCTFNEAQLGKWIHVDRVPDKKVQKQKFGSWRPDGIHYLQLEKDSWIWVLKKHDFTTKNNSICQDDVGPFAKMIGYVDNEPLTYAEHAKFDCKLNWDGDVEETTEQSRLEEYGSTTSDGRAITIRGKCNSDFSEVVEFRLEGGMLQSRIIYSEQDLKSIISPDKKLNDAPRGELQDISVDGEDIVLNFNIDGACRIFRGCKKGSQLKELELDSIREDTGPFWVDSMHLKNEQLVMEISSFRVPPHIWHFDLDKEAEPKRLTDPSTSPVKIGTVEPKVHASTDQQYLLIEPDSDCCGTMIFFHGGPTVPMRGEWNIVIASFLVSGFRVITPNPRGSLGRGPRFAGLDDGHLRLNLIDDDIAPFLESMKQEFGELFMYGGSYGGWLVLKIATSTCGSFVRAGVTRNGIGDFKTFYSAIVKDFPWRREHRDREYIGLNISQEEREIFLSELNPVNSKLELFCKNIYLFTGKKDTRVTPESSEEWVHKHNKPDENEVKHLSFKDEGHKIKRHENLVKILEKTIKFFRKHSER